MTGFKTTLALFLVIAASTGLDTCTITSNGFLGIDSGSLRRVGFDYDLTVTSGADPNGVIPVLARAFIQELSRDLLVLCGAKNESGITGFQTGGRDTIVVGATNTTCLPSQITTCFRVHCNMTVYVKETSFFVLERMNETMQLKSKANVFNSTVNSQIVSVRLDDKSWKFETIPSPPSPSIPVPPTSSSNKPATAAPIPATVPPITAPTAPTLTPPKPSPTTTVSAPTAPALTTPTPLKTTPTTTAIAPTAPALTTPTLPKTTPTTAATAPTAPALTTPTGPTSTTSKAANGAASPALNTASSPTEPTKTGKSNTTLIIIVSVVVVLVALGVAFFCYRRYTKNRGAPVKSQGGNDRFKDEDSDEESDSS